MARGEGLERLVVVAGAFPRRRVEAALVVEVGPPVAAVALHAVDAERRSAERVRDALYPQRRRARARVEERQRKKHDHRHDAADDKQHRRRHDLLARRLVVVIEQG